MRRTGKEQRAQEISYECRKRKIIHNGRGYEDPWRKIKKNSFYEKIKRHGIVPVKLGIYLFYTDGMIGDLKNDRRRGLPKPEEKRPRKRKAAARKKKCPRYCWRVSEWNDELMGYVVVKCGLTKKEADEFATGKTAVKRPCWR